MSIICNPKLASNDVTEALKDYFAKGGKIEKVKCRNRKLPRVLAYNANSVNGKNKGSIPFINILRNPPSAA